MHSTLVAQLSSGLCGFTLNHSDIGGYNALISPQGKLFRDAQVLWRWVELGIFGAVFRSHEGNIPPAHHQLYSCKETGKFLASMLSLFMALEPYRRNLMSLAQEKGYPLVRALFMHFPRDPECDEIDDQVCTFVVYNANQFMFGDALLVAPVFERDLKTRSVYLPTGSKWKHIWSDKSFDGGQRVTVDAPYGNIPVFLRDERTQDLEKFLAAVKEFKPGHALPESS